MDGGCASACARAFTAAFATGGPGAPSRPLKGVDTAASSTAARIESRTFPPRAVLLIVCLFVEACPVVLGSSCERNGGTRAGVVEELIGATRRSRRCEPECRGRDSNPHAPVGDT